MPEEEFHAEWEREESPEEYGPEKQPARRRPATTEGRKGRKAHIVCKFYMQGRCRMGTQCPYYHEGDKADGQANEEVKEEKDEAVKEVETKEEAIQETEEAPKIPPKNKTRICKFYARGFCWDYEECQFRHDQNEEQGKNTARPGDWRCHQCGRWVFSYRDTCLCGSRNGSYIIAPQEEEEKQDAEMEELRRKAEKRRRDRDEAEEKEKKAVKRMQEAERREKEAVQRAQQCKQEAEKKVEEARKIEEAAHKVVKEEERKRKEAEEAEQEAYEEADEDLKQKNKELQEALEVEKKKREKAEKQIEEAKRETERMEAIGEQWRSLYQGAMKKKRE